MIDRGSAKKTGRHPVRSLRMRALCVSAGALVAVLAGQDSRSRTFQPVAAAPARMAAVSSKPAPQPAKPKNTASLKCSTGTKVGEWCDMPSTSYPFEVWVKRATNIGAAEKQAAAVTNAIDKVWGPMTEDFGQPLADIPRKPGGPNKADTGNDNGKVDVYAVTPGESIMRDGAGATVSTTASGTPAAAQAPTTPAQHPPSELATSGYVLVDPQHIGTAVSEHLFAHEFFHLLEFRYNGHPQSCNPLNWFFESAAEWAAAHYLPDTAARFTYESWYKDFQQDPASLESTQYNHQYASFIWPYFMEQSAGGIAPIKAAFVNMQGKSGCDALNGAIDDAFSFRDNFWKFALRNLNDKKFGSLSPIVPLFSSLHGDFPSGAPYTPQTQEQYGGKPEPEPVKAIMRGDDPVRLDAGLGPLEAKYWHFGRDMTTAHPLNQIQFDFKNVDDYATLDLDAVVHLQGENKWVEVPLAHDIPRPRLCLDSEYKDADEFYLVLSNWGYHTADVTRGEVLARPSQVSCTCPDPGTVAQYNGSVTITYSGGGSGENGSFSQSFRGTGTATLHPDDGWADTFSGALSGSVSDNESFYPTEATGPQTITADTGFWQVGDPALSVAFFPYGANACTYLITANMPFQDVVTFPGPPSETQQDGTDVLSDVPGTFTSSLTLSGSRQVPVGVNAPWEDPMHGFVNVDAAASLVKGAPDTQYGTATVTWNLSPVLRSGLPDPALGPGRLAFKEKMQNLRTPGTPWRPR